MQTVTMDIFVAYANCPKNLGSEGAMRFRALQKYVNSFLAS